MDYFFSRWFWMPLALAISILIYRTGKQYLQFEEMHDDRVSSIPDKEIRHFWRKLSSTNVMIGNIYINIVGPYFIFISVVNIFFLLILRWNIPEIFNRGILSLLMVCLLFLSLFMSNLGRNYYGNGAWGGTIGLDMRAFKRTIFNLYKDVNFQSRDSELLTKKQLNLISYIDHLVKIPFFLKTGMLIWYVTWGVWALLATVKLIMFNL